MFHVKHGQAGKSWWRCAERVQIGNGAWVARRLNMSAIAGVQGCST